MPTNKPFSLSGMVDTDAEGESIADALPSPDSNQENAGRGKRKVAKTKANAKKFTRQKRSSGDSVDLKPEGTTKHKSRKGKAPLREQPGNAAIDLNEVDEFAHSDGASISKNLTKARSVAKRKAAEQPSERPAKLQATKDLRAERDGEFEYTPTAVRQKKNTRTTGDKNVKGRTSMMSNADGATKWLETQTQVKARHGGTPEGDDDHSKDAPDSTFRQSGHARSGLGRRLPTIARHMNGNVSDNEGVSGEPALRRKLGDTRRKLESLESKYKDLKEIGVKEAEANYERLKKQADVNANAANDLIDSLRREIATHKAIAQESTGFQAQIESRGAEVQKVQCLADDLSRSLVEAQNENKVLQAKLNASRSTSVPRDKPSGSTANNATQQLSRNHVSSNAETMQAVQAAQLKEDLYSDLTGLILRGVCVGNEEDVFDCIQTGRNGTLHFKVAVAKDSENNYEDTEFQYTPRLDNDRDRDLIALLPEYLTEEISFSRMNAASFYWRVLETLTKRRVTDSEG